MVVPDRAQSRRAEGILQQQLKQLENSVHRNNYSAAMKPYLILIITLSCVLVGCSTTSLKSDSGEAKELNASSSSKPLYKEVPWDWLLGHWNIENSEGKKTKVHWWQPDPKSDYLLGKWEHEDGTWETQLVGWRQDTQTLSSHSYGSNGTYGEIKFTEFTGRKKMKGTFRRREGDGKIVTGTFEAHQISDGLVHTRQVLSDGTVMTGKTTRVSAQ